LPFLQEPADESGRIPEPSGFRTSFIVLPLLTVAVAVGLARYTGQENQHRTLFGHIRAMWEELLQALRRLWELLPRLPERERRGSSSV